MTDDRINKRRDPEVWSDQHRRQVKTLYGMVVGGMLITASIALLFWLVINERVDPLTLTLCVGMAILGLVAGLPGTFMPVLSFVLKRIKLPFWKSIPETNGEITRALEVMKEDNDGEV